MKPKCPRCGVTGSHERVSTVMRAWFRCATCNFVWRASVLASWHLFGDGRAVPRTAVAERTREDEFDPAQIRLPGDRLAANAESDDAPGLESVDANLSPPPPAVRRRRHRRERARAAEVPSTRPDADASFLRDVNPGRGAATRSEPPLDVLDESTAVSPPRGRSEPSLDALESGRPASRLSSDTGAWLESVDLHQPGTARTLPFQPPRMATSLRRLEALHAALGRVARSLGRDNAAYHTIVKRWQPLPSRIRTGTDDDDE